MAKINEVNRESDSEYVTEDEQLMTEDVDDLMSDVSEEDADAILKESLWERLVALQDVVPESKRDELWKSAQSVAKSVWGVSRLMGNVAWILSTSFLVVLMPVLLEIERHNAYAQAEKEAMQAQQILQQHPGQTGQTPSMPGMLLPTPPPMKS